MDVEWQDVVVGARSENGAPAIVPKIETESEGVVVAGEEGEGLSEVGLGDGRGKTEKKGLVEVMRIDGRGVEVRAMDRRQREIPSDEPLFGVDEARRGGGVECKRGDGGGGVDILD